VPQTKGMESRRQLSVAIETIEQRILVLRRHRVMLDRDLAQLFGVPVKRLNEQVKRNIERFPEDFMFRLTPEEAAAVRASRSQIATLKRGRNLKYSPNAFTEHGAVMLANVLKSPTAIRASIQVVRAFVRLRQILAGNAKVARQIEALEQRVGKHDTQLQALLNAVRGLLKPPPSTPRRRIGYRT
jgi:hypothetical protein